jgi:hypothetical protein
MLSGELPRQRPTPACCPQTMDMRPEAAREVCERVFRLRHTRNRIMDLRPKNEDAPHSLSRFNETGRTVPGDRETKRERVMTRSAATRRLAKLLCWAGLAGAGPWAWAQDQPPPLEPPALLPPAPAPAPATPHTPGQTGVPPRANSTKSAENRSLLVIPGVTAPLPPGQGAQPVRSKESSRKAVSTPTSRSPDGESPKPTRAVRSLPRPSSGTSNSIPLTLEAIPDEPPAELGSERQGARRPAPRGGARSGFPEPKEPAPARSTAPEAPTRSSSSIFGRILRPLGANEDIAPPRSSARVEPRSDPAAEAALKRRIEKQVEQSLGDRVRSVEVRIANRTVIFRAQASRFWYRRNVRRSLESMPLPSGYRAVVEGVD